MDRFFDGLFIVGGTLVIVVLFILGISTYGTEKNITVKSKISSIEDGKDYMIIHFSDSQVFNVNYPNDKTVINFDDTKTVTIRLRYRNAFWCTNTNDCWDIMNVIKY
jgi:hypothetical protein